MSQVKKEKISVIIPVFNEEGAIGSVLQDIPRNLADEIIVVDNGSTDRSAEIASAGGATVLRETHRGYGNACLKGIKYLAKNPPDIVVFLDGDYSDFPEEMIKLVDKIADGYDLVLGSRIMGRQVFDAKLPVHSVWGNKLAAFLLNRLFRGNYSDLGPFRAIRYQKLLVLNMGDPDYGWTIEMQIKALKHGLSVAEIPVHYRSRLAGQSKVTGSFPGSIKAAIKILLTVLLYFFGIKK